MASSLKVLLTNDDGFESANSRALFECLKEAGHDVILSAPAHNSSGTGGAVDFLVPLGPLQKDSRWGTVKAGAPGVGPDPEVEDIYYVGGSPVTSLLYGLDVVAFKKWGCLPDLVIAGPNYGNNTGAIVFSSGTVNTVLYAINRGIPAIAVSAGELRDRSYLSLQPGDMAEEIAQVVLHLVQQLDRSRSADGRLLERGIGLNVNLPKFKPGEGRKLPFRFSRVGRASLAFPVFVEQLADSEIARQLSIPGQYPGVSIILGGETIPDKFNLSDDMDPLSEQNVIDSQAVAISVLQGSPQAEESREKIVKGQLSGLFE